MVLSKHYQVSEVEISYKQHPTLQTNPKITSSYEAYKAFMATWNQGTIDLKEEFKVMLMNRSNRVIGIYNAHIGGRTDVCADPRIIFVTALKANATCMILAHNHPSRNLKPSQADLDISKSLKQAGELLRIAIIDNLIIGSEGYTSFADLGLL